MTKRTESIGREWLADLFRRPLLTVLVALLLSGAAPSLAQEGWVASTSGVLHDLKDVDIRHDGQQFAVGEFGTIIASTDSGQSWTEETSGTTEDLWGVDFYPPTGEIHAVGYLQTFLKRIDGAWTGLNLQEGFHYFGVRQINDDTVFAVGSRFSQPSFLMLNDQTVELAILMSTSDVNGFGSDALVNDQGQIFATTDFNTGSGAIHQGNNWGSMWTVAEGTGDEMNSIEFIQYPNRIIAVGDSGLMYLSEDSGTSWDTVAPPTSADLKDIAVHEHNGMTFVHVVGSEGTVLVSTDLGLNWNVQPTPEDSLTLRAVAFAGMGVIVGDDGLVLTTTNNGYPADNDPPAAFDIIEPLNGATVARDQGLFRWHATSDPNGDAVQYRLEVSLDDSTVLDTMTGADTTFTLDFNQLEAIPSAATAGSWSVRATDGALYTAATGAPFAFTLEANAQPPTDFTLIAPVDGAQISRAPTSFTWHRSQDPENAEVHYLFSLTLEGDLAQITAQVTDTSFVFDFSTLENLPEQAVGGSWSVAATDPHYETVAGNAPFSFTVEGAQSAPDADEPGRIHRFALHPAHPNPFNGETEVRYELPRSGEVELAVFDLLGRRVRVLADGRERAGQHLVRWDGTDAKGESVTSGVYFLRLAGPGEEGARASRVRRLVVLE